MSPEVSSAAQSLPSSDNGPFMEMPDKTGVAETLCKITGGVCIPGAVWKATCGEGPLRKRLKCPSEHVAFAPQAR